MMMLLRNLLYALFFYPGSTIIVLTGVLFLPFGRGPAITACYVWGCYTHWCARTFLGIRTVVEGDRPTGEALYAVKHESMYETTEMMRLLYDPAVVFKRELLRIPFWGWIAQRHGVIPVDRDGGASQMRALLAEAKRVRAEGRNALIYPEGTRVPHGASPPLRPGFAGLYKALGLPVVPVALDTGRVWPRKGLKRPGTVTIRFGVPIPTGIARDEIEARVHAAINVLN
jgi:1-acyl-sn-glycerol-3-phosphate acyltransferase